VPFLVSLGLLDLSGVEFPHQPLAHLFDAEVVVLDRQAPTVLARPVVGRSLCGVRRLPGAGIRAEEEIRLGFGRLPQQDLSLLLYLRSRFTLRMDLRPPLRPPCWFVVGR
jgi:hypothetical protein